MSSSALVLSRQILTMQRMSPELGEFGTQVRNAINSLNSQLASFSTQQSTPAAAAASAQSARTAAILSLAGLASVSLPADVNVTGGTPAALTGMAVTVNMPATGGPYRIIVFGSVTYVTGGQGLWKAWIQDSLSNVWNGRSSGINAANLRFESIPLDNISPVTYPAGAAITITPYAESNNSYSPGVKQTDNFSGAASWIVAAAVASS